MSAPLILRATHAQLNIKFNDIVADTTQVPAAVTLVGSPAYTDGMLGRAINWSATSMYASIASTVGKLQFTQSAAYTISAIIKPTDASNGTANHFIFCKYTTLANQYGFYFAITPGNDARPNRLRYFMRNTSVVNVTDVTSDVEVSHDRWSFVTMTKAGGTGTSQIKFYINGARVAETYATNIANAVGTYNAANVINAYSNGAAVSSNMLMQHLVIHDVELTPQEIAIQYQAMKGAYLL